MAPRGRSRSCSPNAYREELSPKPKYPFDVKTLQCYYWTHGDCTWGNDCRYAHFYTGKVAEKPVKRANGFSVAGRNAIAEKPVYRKWQGQPPASSTTVDESKNRARPGQYRWEPYSNGSRKSSLGSGARRNERGSHEQGSLAPYEGDGSSENESKGWKISSSPLEIDKRGRNRSPVRDAVKSGSHSRRARSHPRSTKPHMEVKPATLKQEHSPTRAPQYYAKQSSDRDGSGRSPELSKTLQNNDNDNHHTLSTHQNIAPHAINNHTTSPARNTTNQVKMSQYPKSKSSSDSLVTAYRDDLTEGSPPVPLADPVTPMRMSSVAEHGQPIPSITDLPNHNNRSGSGPAPIDQTDMGRSAMGRFAMGHSATGLTSLGQRIVAHDAYGRPFQAWRAPSNDPNNPQSKLILVPAEEFNHMTAAIVQFQHTNESIRGRVSSAESTIETQDNLLAESSIILDNGRKILLAEGQLAMDMCQKIQRGEPIHPDEVASAWLTATHMQAQANAFHRMLKDWEACISTRQGNGHNDAAHSGNAGDDSGRADSYNYSGSVPTVHSGSNIHHNSSSSTGGDYSSAHMQGPPFGEPNAHPGNGHSSATGHFAS